MTDRTQDHLRALAIAMERRLSKLGDDFEAAAQRLMEPLNQATKQIGEVAQRWQPALTLVCSELPRRGWYLTGHEPITFISELAAAIETGDLEEVDRLLLEHTDDLEVDQEVLDQWLVQEGVPRYTIERVRLVLESCKADDHTVATIVGLTVLDEVTRHLYDERDFTTKRGRQPRPQIGVSTSSASRSLGPVAEDFVASFGMLHNDVEPSLLADEDYFNRAAILHGKMRRTYSQKDSAKVKLLLMFVVCGCEE